jgi:hypothetical protein
MRTTNMSTATCTAGQAGAILDLTSKLLVAAHNVGGYGAELTLTPEEDTPEDKLDEASVSLGKFQIIGRADAEGFINKVHLFVNGIEVEEVDKWIAALDAAVSAKEEANPNFHPLTALACSIQLLKN